ncbi:hypothetical protein DPMN_111952 [Dreissena polymorpha]|uniref:Uncharacterized protein n=1 Tax=Dreissena polymorpha TaxID=45954 RepID=A0A9D4QPH0_DREPO|nr:hypothetical protein DPMN_111952 [Dreissena polymorpha]
MGLALGQMVDELREFKAEKGRLFQLRLFLLFKMERRINQSLLECKNSLKGAITSRLLRVHAADCIIPTGNKCGSNHCSRQSQ